VCPATGYNSGRWKATGLVDYYSRRAPEYERTYLAPERQPDLRALEALVLNDLAGHDVLEIACGTGWWTERIAKVARSIVATDASEEVLAIARIQASAAGTGPLEIADAFDPGSVAGSFSAAFAGFWWSHVPRERIAPGSDACTADRRRRARRPGRQPLRRREQHAGGARRRRGQQLPAPPAGRRHGARGHQEFPAADELRAAVAGIAADIQITELTYYWRMSYRVAGSER
jgi:demethylmenaquinone methyltransferase/2-methoxy-6-polyprenyl-1,4-benzoquinol methylase